MNEILAVFLPCHHLVCNWFSVICFYFEQGGWRRVAGFSAHQSLLVLFALIIFTAADLAALLSSFSADTACQHGASLAGDSSPLFGSGSREVTIPSTTLLSPPPSSPVLPRQARRLLSCLVETAPLRLARSAAVRAQLRLPGTHVARFHLWVSVWPQEWVDIRTLMHANAGTLTSARPSADKQHINTRVLLVQILCCKHTYLSPCLSPLSLSLSPHSPAPLAPWHPSTSFLPTCF